MCTGRNSTNDNDDINNNSIQFIVYLRANLDSHCQLKSQHECKQEQYDTKYNNNDDDDINNDNNIKCVICARN
jgi:hypothetical protein